MSCNPANVPDLSVWLKGDDAATGAVTTWADASGNGNNGTGVNSPTGVNAVLNGHKVVRFVADSLQHFTLPDFASSFTEAEVFIVIKINADPPASGSKVGIWSLADDLASVTTYPWTDSVVYEAFGSTVRKTVGDPTPSLASWRVYSVRSAANDWEAYLDGTSLFSTGTNTVSFTNSPLLGQSAPGFPTNLDGDIAEFVMFSRGLSTDERGNVWHYLGEKFGLSIANTVACGGGPSFRIPRLRPAIFTPGLAR